MNCDCVIAWDGLDTSSSMRACCDQEFWVVPLEPTPPLLDLFVRVSYYGWSPSWPLRRWVGRFDADRRQVDAAIEPSDGKPVDVDVMVTFAIIFYAGRTNFKPAESRAAFSFHGIGSMRERFFLGHAEALAALQVKRKVVVAAVD